MFPNLKAEMARKGIVNADLQKLLNLSERTVRNKMDGISEFKWNEVMKIRDSYFPGMTTDYLMARTDKQAG